MPTVLEAREGAAVRYHRWSVEDYHRMAGSGLLDQTQRVELIDGELIDRAPIGSRHAFLVDRLAELLGGGPRAAYMVRTQNPLRLGSNSEPQPDIALVRRDDYADHHPGPADILLIVEVCDSSLAYDREIKLPLYARHGIPEVWLLDVSAGAMTLYSEPAEGQYRLIRKPTASAVLAPLLLPALSLKLAELL